MPITPIALLQQAENFPKNDELSVRASVNRAYYAAFHAANQFHSKLPAPGKLPIQGCGIHETLFHQLVNPTLPAATPENTKSRQIGLIGKDLKNRRKIADYDIGCTVSLEDGEYAIAQASSLLNLAQ